MESVHECIFCKIINREMESNIVFEDENYLAILDINPITEGHILLIPKKQKAQPYLYSQAI